MDTETRSRQLLALAQAVILGVLLIETSASLIRLISLSNHRFFIQLTALLIFWDLYIMLGQYHGDITLPYKRSFLFYDLFLLGLPFIVLAQLIKKSWENESFLFPGMILCLSIFLLFFFRQLLNFRQIKNAAQDTTALTVSMFANWLGVLITMAGVVAVTDGHVYGVMITHLALGRL